MATTPREPGLDHTLALLREGYDFIGNRCARFGSDIFETRLMLRRVICVRGPDAAEMFYDGERFTRVGAMPVTVSKLLQDAGSVQTLDDAPHRHRKDLFLSLAGPDAAADLSERVSEEWSRRLDRWRRRDRIVLFDEMREILSQSALAWAGTPQQGTELARRTRELSEMVERAGSFGPRMARALLLRHRSEKWAREVIRNLREAPHSGRTATPADRIARYRDSDGNRLDIAVAGVELLNLLRPTVAIAHFLVFAAKALHDHPEARDEIRAGNDGYLAAFVEEVRRLTPFFPVIGGRAREDFTWLGVQFSQGDWVLLDLYGTNRDAKTWPEPATFRPERFLERQPSLFDLVPQGAGDAAKTHRCPGETITVEIMKTTARLLATLDYQLPPQDLSIDRSRIPALPKSGFVLTGIWPAA